MTPAKSERLAAGLCVDWTPRAYKRHRCRECADIDNRARTARLRARRAA